MHQMQVHSKHPSPIFQLFFKLLGILVSQESSYFSYNQWQILQLKTVLFGKYNENMPGYGSHLHRATQ